MTAAAELQTTEKGCIHESLKMDLPEKDLSFIMSHLASNTWMISDQDELLKGDSSRTSS